MIEWVERPPNCTGPGAFQYCSDCERIPLQPFRRHDGTLDQRDTLRCRMERTVPTDLDVALDALELMVEQYMGDRDSARGAGYEHAFMSAGEEATEVLARLRPDRWEALPWGLRRRAPTP